MEEILYNVINVVTSAGLKLIWALIVLVVGLKCSKWVSKIVSKSAKFPGIDEGVKKFFANTLKITLYIVVIISVAGIIGVPYASFITVLGSAGVAIGLALQGSLSNIAGGILILVTRPFRTGDFIEAMGVSGKVDEIGFFTTSVVTPDNKKIFIPNGTLSNSSIINYSVMPVRRVDLTFSAGYGSDIEQVKKILIDEAEAHCFVHKEPVPFAGLSEQGDSALVFTLRVWCNNEHYWDVMFDLTEKIKYEFDKNNIEIPFPKLDINVSKQN